MTQRAPHDGRLPAHFFAPLRHKVVKAGAWAAAPLPLLLLLVAGTPSSGAAHSASVQSAPIAAPVGAQSVREGPALAAKYAASTTATTTDGSTRAEHGDWYLNRGHDRIERVRPDVGTAEIWERDDRGEVSLKRVFREEARIVEYAPGNLRAMQLQARWEALGAAVDPRLVRSLEKGATVETPHGTATVFQGTLAGVRTEVWWLDAVQLPARVIEQRQSTRVVIELQALHAHPPADWPQADLPGQAPAEVIDVADLGDRHYDPFVRRVEQADAALRSLGSPGR